MGLRTKKCTCDQIVRRPGDEDDWFLKEKCETCTWRQKIDQVKDWLWMAVNGTVSEAIPGQIVFGISPERQEHDIRRHKAYLRHCVRSYNALFTDDVVPPFAWDWGNKCEVLSWDLWKVQLVPEATTGLWHMVPIRTINNGAAIEQLPMEYVINNANREAEAAAWEKELNSNVE